MTKRLYYFIQALGLTLWMTCDGWRDALVGFVAVSDLARFLGLAIMFGTFWLFRWNVVEWMNERRKDKSVPNSTPNWHAISRGYFKSAAKPGEEISTSN